MAREKGMGNLQLEKSGRWTIRFGFNGRRLSRATGTCDRAKAEKMMMRILAPLGRGENRLPLADIWDAYLRSPNRRDLAPTTLAAKRIVWLNFSRWMENVHAEISSLAEVTSESIAEYLCEFKVNHTATSYNNHVCILREIFRVLADKAGLVDDPWRDVRLRPNDCHTRRALTVDELQRLLRAAGNVAPHARNTDATAAEITGDAAPRQADACPPSRASGTAGAAQRSACDQEWHTLFLIGIYTGLRLGDCCHLKWEDVDLERGIIQLIPGKTAKFAHGRPVTIPLHPRLRRALENQSENDPFVLPAIAKMYRSARWRVSTEIAKIFRTANIEMHVKVEGRTRLATEASFHSLRHTFVSFAANAGVPLAVVQSIVGHSSTLMTRHYYHESEAALQAAVASLPSFESAI